LKRLERVMVEILGCVVMWGSTRRDNVNKVAGNVIS
jgi:hypothetical protein